MSNTLFTIIIISNSVNIGVQTWCLLNTFQNKKDTEKILVKVQQKYRQAKIKNSDTEVCN